MTVFEPPPSESCKTNHTQPGTARPGTGRHGTARHGTVGNAMRRHARALRGHACWMRLSFGSRYRIGTLAAELRASIA
jgi:hypothetical protein